ncbi:flagellar hook-length control protein FliK [Tabrizicola sp.]|uniref:flagellar hook-length control protein FliK n=1 Tax=Tabrizicola sp. TaxID=2005166 RepID=UPI0027330608|nr:flagellar hook-length control protein FliK [Tabrizicola sp.]MDP3194011.1 flagellar hook-length control protein FliK [Tabrizicola sp.]
MQTGLVLSPRLTPVPETGGDSPPAPDGAFLASFEAEPPVAEAPAGPPVMLAMPVSPVIAGASAATASKGTEAAQPRATGVSPRAGTVEVEAEAVNSEDLTLPGRVRGTEGGKAAFPSGHQSAERTHGDGRDGGAAGPIPGRNDRAAAPGSGPSDQGSANRSTVADAARTASRLKRDGEGQGPAVSGLSDVVRNAVLARAEGSNQAATPEVENVQPATPEASASATGRQPGTTLQAAQAWRVAPEVGQEPSSLRVEHRKNLPQTVAPILMSGPDSGPAAIAPVAHATRELKAQDQGGSLAVQPQESAAAGHLALPDIAERQQQESQARPGLWESMFSSLALPVSAVGQGVRALRPVLTVGMEGVPQVPPVGDQGGIAIPQEPAADPRGSQAVLTAPIPPTTEIPKAATPLPTLMTSWLQPMPWMTAAVDPDGTTGDEGLQTPFAPGAVANAAVASGPSAALATPSSPVPNVAGQMTAALSQGADGATELALSPDELGRVSLRLEPDSANPDRMVVMITFERPETLDLFRRHAGELAEALRAAGYAGADIGFGQDRSGSSGSEDSHGRSDDWGMGQDQPAPDPVLSPAPRLAAGASLDLRL